MGKINGILLPGGATYFNNTNGYADAGRHIYDIAIEMNDNGDYFPIFGTCLGMELLAVLSAGEDNRSICWSQKQTLPLEFEKGMNSKILICHEMFFLHYNILFTYRF